MAGIYLHIPFCKTRCHYCNFYALASTRYRGDLVQGLIDEITFRRDYLGDQPVGSIYFGGGTPSLLDAGELNRIFSCIEQNFRIEDAAEITLEANPDDIDEKWLSGLKGTPVNRISMGVQSFRDEDLRYLNRIHSSDQALDAVRLIQESGRYELTIDLIYGIPGMDEQAWEFNLDTFFGLSIPHLSAYALTVEEKTPLKVMIDRKKMTAPDENAAVGHFKRLLELTDQKGYLHYEISNFALEGHYSRHNSIYWTGGHYLGAGPSAHSFNGQSRRWNVSSVKKWLEGKDNYHEVAEEEILSKEQRYNEYVMTSLRTMWGCDSGLVSLEFGDSFADHLLREAQPYVLSGKLYLKEGRLFLSDKGKLFADGIASDLFI